MFLQDFIRKNTLLCIFCLPTLQLVELEHYGLYVNSVCLQLLCYLGPVFCWMMMMGKGNGPLPFLRAILCPLLSSFITLPNVIIFYTFLLFYFFLFCYRSHDFNPFSFTFTVKTHVLVILTVKLST